MNAKTLKWLAVAAIALVIVLIAVDTADRGDTVSSGEPLLPELKEHINDVTRVVVTGDAGFGTVTVAFEDGEWRVAEKGDYPADVGTLRKVLLAVADARILEQKTANPERYADLGVADPPEGEGMLLEISGADFSHALIVGDTAQSKYRYVRIADRAQSLLVNQNPDLPADAGGWLEESLLDVDASRVRSVAIEHADGETIRIGKASPEDTSFTVEDLPEGRELSYATVADGIAGALNDLRLEDVRRSDAGEAATTTMFTTFDGLVVTLKSVADGDDGSWVSVSAEAQPAAAVADAVPEDAATEAPEAEAAADEPEAAAAAAEP
ncbi:MAG: DUF4340 domain-containing protein, partial [Woeseiaceae bacterium]